MEEMYTTYIKDIRNKRNCRLTIDFALQIWVCVFLVYFRLGVGGVFFFSSMDCMGLHYSNHKLPSRSVEGWIDDSNRFRMAVLLLLLLSMGTVLPSGGNPRRPTLFWRCCSMDWCCCDVAGDEVGVGGDGICCAALSSLSCIRSQCCSFNKNCCRRLAFGTAYFGCKRLKNSMMWGFSTLSKGMLAENKARAKCQSNMAWDLSGCCCCCERCCGCCAWCCCWFMLSAVDVNESGLEVEKVVDAVGERAASK